MFTSLQMVWSGARTWFSLFLLTLHLSVSDQWRFTFVNECEGTVWPASFTTGGDSNNQTIVYSLRNGDTYTMTTPRTWNGQLWGRTHCEGKPQNLNFSCAIGDCGTGKMSCDDNQVISPVTVAEFRVGDSNLYYYNVNVVEGFNIPLAVTPVRRSGKHVIKCSSAGCPTNLNTMCPAVALNCSTESYKIIFCPASSTGSLNQSVSVRDSLTAENGTTYWLSPSGDFAFGFFQLPNELFLLAIWYAKIQNDSIIWYANGDSPAPKGSRLVLNDSHGLVLTSPEGSELWKSSEFTLGRISFGLMKDDGNFQLRDQNFVVLWQSFSYFSDTLVPGQVLNSNNRLYSRKGEFNFSRGMFELRLQKDGHGLLLSLINFTTNTYYSTQHDAYYESRIVDPDNYPLDVGDKLIFDKDYFSLYIRIKENGKQIYITNPTTYVSNGNYYYYKATINHDGVFTLSYYPRNPKIGHRWIVAKIIPENICLNSKSNNGIGICGLNSICSLRDDQRPKCTCLEGYSLIDSNNMYGGCVPNFQVNICQCSHQGSQNDTHVMTNFSNTYLPKFDYQPLSPCTIQECSEYCMQDGWCLLVFFNESSSWKKKLPLSHGRKDLSIKGTSIIKIRRNDILPIIANVTKDNDLILNNTKKKRDYGSLMILMSIILGFSIVIIIALLCTISFWHNHKKIESSGTNIRVVDRNLRIFTYKEIKEATNNFREELGRGSCSIVYKGTIDVDTNVAVKKLDKLFQDSDKEFQTEMSVIVETHHRNLVRLHGYYMQEQHRILVYEVMSNGTLASFLFAPLKPSWSQRVRVAIGIARGLVYLHEECCTQIIHCDIKPQNILLDDDYNAKISDFGLAKLLLINQSHTKTGIRGTKGYVAPDWFRSAPVTAKVDVYSFGVLLLEIIFCRKNVEGDNVSEEKRILTDWAYDCYKATKLDLLLENECEAVDDMSRVEKFVMIAIWCTQEDPSLRPMMKRVLLMLEEIVDVTIPPSPYLYGSFG